MTLYSLPWALVAFLLLLLGRLSAAANDQVVSQFTYPDVEGLTFYASSSVILTWIADFEEAYIVVWCAQGDKFTMKRNITDIGSKRSYELKIDFDVASGTDRCWVNLKNGVNNDGMNSPNFKVLPSTKIQTTFSLSSRTSTTMKTTSSTSSLFTTSHTGEAAATTVTTTTTEASSRETSSSQPTQSSSELSAGAKAGIAIGVIVGVLGAGALGFLFWRRRRKAAEAEATEPEGAGDWKDTNKDEHPRASELPGPVPPVEADSRGVPQELPA